MWNGDSRYLKNYELRRSAQNLPKLVKNGQIPDSGPITPSQQALHKVADQNLRLLAFGQVKALKIFADEEFIRRDVKVLQAFGVDQSGAKLLSKSRFSTRRQISTKLRPIEK